MATLLCPGCGSITRILYTFKPGGTSLRRRRTCTNARCGNVFETVEAQAPTAKVDTDKIQVSMIRESKVRAERMRAARHAIEDRKYEMQDAEDEL